MITATGLELRAGSRILMDDATFRVGPGDRVGLVGRNGAGKTTLTRVLAGEGQPAAGTVTRSGDVGYLPQDPRTGDLDVLARDRILSARGLDRWSRRLRETEGAMASADDETPRARRWSATAGSSRSSPPRGGYAAEAEAAAIASSLGPAERVLGQPLRTLSGGQRRRVELARILFSGAETLLLDEPTNHLDADSIVWLRDFLHRPTRAAWWSSATTSSCSRPASTRCSTWTPTGPSSTSTTWAGRPTCSSARPTSGAASRERANAEKKAAALLAQADKMRAKATKAVAAQNMARRAERMLSGLEDERASDKVAKLALPRPGAVRPDPADRRASCPSRTARSRSSPTSTWPSTGAARSSSSA